MDLEVKVVKIDDNDNKISAAIWLETPLDSEENLKKLGVESIEPGEFKIVGYIDQDYLSIQSNMDLYELLELVENVEAHEDLAQAIYEAEGRIGTYTDFNKYTLIDNVKTAEQAGIYLLEDRIIPEDIKPYIDYATYFEEQFKQVGGYDVTSKGLLLSD